MYLLNCIDISESEEILKIPYHGLHSAVGASLQLRVSVDVLSLCNLICYEKAHQEDNVVLQV